MTQGARTRLEMKRPGLKRQAPKPTPCVPLQASFIKALEYKPAPPALKDRFSAWVRSLGARLIRYGIPGGK